MVGPAVIIMAAVLGVPTFVGIVMSFQYNKLTRPKNFKAWVGVDNYLEMLGRPDFYAAVGRSLVYTLGVVALSYTAGLFFAVLLNNKFRARGIFRAILMLPWAVPLVAGVLVWGVMMDTNFGLINKILAAVGLPSGNQWLLDQTTAMSSLVVIDSWHQFPLAMLFLLAGLQSVPQELYEAAEMDGANARQRLWHVTLPSIRGVSLVTVLMMTIWSFRRFEVVFLLTGGGPANATETLIIQTYNEAFTAYEFSYAATLGVASLVVSMGFAFVYFAVRKRVER
jgi:multiple sugar transport system permease protein